MRVNYTMPVCVHVPLLITDRHKEDMRAGLVCLFVCLFVCVEVLRPSQPNGVMSSAVSLPNHTFTGQAQSSTRLTSIVHILSPETDNCPS